MAEYNEQIHQNTLKYLYNVSSAVPDHLTTLKSLYTTRFRIGEERGNVFLAAHKDRTKLSCTRCCLRLAEGPSECTIKSEKKPSKFAKQVNSKAENGRALSKYQRLYFKKLNLNRNQLVTKCSYCRHEIPRLLTKPVRTTPPDVNMNESIPKKKKKKKKDKFCGLDQSVISLLTPAAKTAAVTIDLVTPTPVIKRPKLKSPKKLTPETNPKAQQRDEKRNAVQNIGLKLGNKNALQNKKFGNNNKEQTPGKKNTTPQKLGNNNNNNNKGQTLGNKKTTPQMLGNNNNNKGQTPGKKKMAPQRLGNNNKGQTPGNKKTTPQMLGNNNKRQTPGKKKTTPQKFGNKKEGQTPGIKKTTPKSAAKKNKAKKENRKKLSNLVANANNGTKKNLNNFLQFFH